MKTMNNHHSEVQWYFVVPPKNDERVLITQRRDGAFRADQIGGGGHYYVSGEKYDGIRWNMFRGQRPGDTNPSKKPIKWRVASGQG